jgi:hypothetical protein
MANACFRLNPLELSGPNGQFLVDLLAEMIDVTSCELFSLQEDVAACLTRAEELERRQEDQEEEYLCFQVSVRGKYSYPPLGGKYMGYCY